MCQGVWRYPVDHSHLGNHPQCSVKSQKSDFFEKNHFSHFLEPKKSIFGGFWGLLWIFLTPIPFVDPKRMVLGGSDFWELLIWDDFYSLFCQKIASKTKAHIRSYQKYDPQNHKFRSQKMYGSPKKFIKGPERLKKWTFWAPKNEKNDFF